LTQLHDLIAERIKVFSKNDPGPEWDGVFQATGK